MTACRAVCASAAGLTGVGVGSGSGVASGAGSCSGTAAAAGSSGCFVSGASCSVEVCSSAGFAGLLMESAPKATPVAISANATAETAITAGFPMAFRGASAWEQDVVPDAFAETWLSAADCSLVALPQVGQNRAFSESFAPQCSQYIDASFAVAVMPATDT